jgi:ATP-dependent Clp protease ATP-binding subunit ClpX
MSDKENMQCSFCGKARENVDKLIAGPDGVYICDECVILSYGVVTANAPSESDSDGCKTPHEIKEYLDQYIVGHSRAKQVLSVAAYNHYKRINSDTGDPDLAIDKSNVLLLGNTGTGKTLFAKTLARCLNVPFAITDSTTITEAGYMGEDVDSLIERLLATADGDVEKAQRGIIYIDEIDKKAKRSGPNNTKDVSGEGVQQALLQLLEGSILKVKTPAGSKRDTVEFDTRNVLFILGGAFVGLDEIISQRLKKNTTIGFTSEFIDSDITDLNHSALPADIIKFGLIPELVGRTPIIVSLDRLTRDNMRAILTQAKNSTVEQNKRLLAMDGIELELGEEYMNQVAEQAVGLKLGARALKSLIENSLISIMFRAPDLRKQGVAKVRMDCYPTDSSCYPTLIYDNGKTETDINYHIEGEK